MLLTLHFLETAAAPKHRRYTAASADTWSIQGVLFIRPGQDWSAPTSAGQFPAERPEPQLPAAHLPETHLGAPHPPVSEVRSEPSARFPAGPLPSARAPNRMAPHAANGSVQPCVLMCPPMNPILLRHIYRTYCQKAVKFLCCHYYYTCISACQGLPPAGFSPKNALFCGSRCWPPIPARPPSCCPGGVPAAGGRFCGRRFMGTNTTLLQRGSGKGDSAVKLHPQIGWRRFTPASGGQRAVFYWALGPAGIPPSARAARFAPGLSFPGAWVSRTRRTAGVAQAAAVQYGMCCAQVGDSASHPKFFGGRVLVSPAGGGGREAAGGGLRGSCMAALKKGRHRGLPLHAAKTGMVPGSLTQLPFGLQGRPPVAAHPESPTRPSILTR